MNITFAPPAWYWLLDECTPFCQHFTDRAEWLSFAVIIWQSILENHTAQAEIQTFITAWRGGSQRGDYIKKEEKSEC